MTTEEKYTDLLNLLEISLIEHKYVDFDNGKVGELSFLRIFKTERKLGVRNLCVVSILPDNVSSISDFSKYFNLVRNTMTKKYAKFPYFKELGTFLIVICPTNIYNELKKEIDSFKDKSGFHMNLILGTVLIDKDNLEYSECLTWGLFISGKHFYTITNTISDWIENKKDLNE